MARPGRRRVERWPFVLLLAACPAAASAHPLDELVQASYLTLVPGGVRLELDLTPGVEVAYHLLPALDRNRDRRIADDEARAFAQSVLGRLTLVLDGRATQWRLEKVVTPTYQAFRLGADIKIYAFAVRPERASPHELRFLNTYRPVTSRYTANIFFQPVRAWRVTAQAHSNDGRVLIVRYSANAR